MSKGTKGIESDWTNQYLCYIARLSLRISHIEVSVQALRKLSKQTEYSQTETVPSKDATRRVFRSGCCRMLLMGFSWYCSVWWTFVYVSINDGIANTNQIIYINSSIFTSSDDIFVRIIQNALNLQFFTDMTPISTHSSGQPILLI